jgi:amidohydrolase
MLDREVWESVPSLLRETVAAITEPYGVVAEVSHLRGVPPVVNDAAAVSELAAAATAAIGAGSVCSTAQSLGGEDFGWMLEKVPGALARLGVRRPGAAVVDLHQSGFDVDESCLDVGVRLLVAAVLSS